MWFFILFMLAGAAIQALVKLALVKPIYRWGTVLLFILPVFMAYPRAAGINTRDFHIIMNAPDTLGSLCILVIIQEAMVLIFGTIMLRRYLLGKKLHFWYYVVLMPSCLFPAGAFIGMVYLFNTCGGMSFQGIALWFTLGMLIITGGLSELLSRAVKDKELLIQWAALLSLTLIFTAMFLPVILGGKTPEGNLITLDLNMLTGIASILLMIVLSGALSYMGIWRKLTAIKNLLTKRFFALWLT